MIYNQIEMLIQRFTALYNRAITQVHSHDLCHYASCYNPLKAGVAGDANESLLFQRRIHLTGTDHYRYMTPSILLP